MHCPRCGCLTFPSARFCPQCGYSLPREEKQPLYAFSASERLWLGLAIIVLAVMMIGLPLGQLYYFGP